MTDQELAKCQSQERADHVDRENPAAFSGLSLGIQPAFSCDENPGTAKPDDRP